MIDRRAEQFARGTARPVRERRSNPSRKHASLPEACVFCRLPFRWRDETQCDRDSRRGDSECSLAIAAGVEPVHFLLSDATVACDQPCFGEHRYFQSRPINEARFARIQSDKVDNISLNIAYRLVQCPGCLPRRFREPALPRSVSPPIRQPAGGGGKFSVEASAVSAT